ncbi:hypothetical protein SOVF_211430 [Spinacia oleracea]|uniref:poly(A)-specific ribonuclease n=1 Tax=Spinacia oleracea TaxID=3562 RepID=A0A9R0HU64_SPIOL|nr:probable CCR4-associated factor 1 homolog 9 [Spinacia oleracea]KNA03202.1 hypothetical protein SOVF_211430 [Spinacia oleracea]
MAYASTIQIRDVWAENLESEFELIRSLIDNFTFISMDTEFPGIVFKPENGSSHKNLPPKANYSLLKQNVDALKIIQVGLTLSDSEGNMPDLGNPKYRYIWQFNFCDFNVAKDQQAADSIELLRNSGIDFDKNLKLGVKSVKFAELMMSSGLVCSDIEVTWVTFHCTYDFAYLLKVLTQLPLPSELSKFKDMVEIFFGERVFDVKFMIMFLDGLYGGLNTVAKSLLLERIVGQSHTAGSDSLLTWMVFQRLRDLYFNTPDRIAKYAGKLYGLESS